jgi:NAD(P)H-hydrate epimerase
VKSVLQNAAVPVVMDADALNIIALHLDLLKRPHTEIVVTPHLGEMARLTENPVTYVADHKLDLCQEFAKDYQVVCALKDASTIIGIPYGLTFLNTSGCEGMATAGSGDVLTGIIAGFIAQGLSPEDAAPLGVYLHGLAGEQASRIHSRHGMVASDLIEGLKIIYQERGL